MKPVEPVAVTSPEAGAVDAGITARQPATLPEGIVLAGAAVARPGEYRVRLDAEKLRSLAQIAGADEIEVPDHWTGATIDVAMPPVLVTRYERAAPDGETRTADAGYVLLQARSPEIELPEGVDLATLGRLALRLGGLSAEEALSFSQRIDWRSTLLVPVPVNGADYREVEVNGQRGLLVSAQCRPRRRPTARGSAALAVARRLAAARHPALGADVVGGRQRLRAARPGQRLAARRDGADATVGPWPSPPSKPARCARTSARRRRSGT